MYYVIEMQTNETGSAIVTTFSNLDDARAKFFDVLKYACKSDVRKHGAIILDENGFEIEPARVFDHSIKE